MFNKLREIFTPKIQTVYKIVDLPTPRTQSRWDDSTREAVSTLQFHPGFMALLERLRLQKHLLESKLTREFHKEFREVDYLQAGVFWLSFIDDTLTRATTKGSSVPKEALDEEMAAFKEIDSHIERVGME